MNKTCSLCGNIYKTRVFRGGFICADCADYIRSIDIAPLLASESTNRYSPNKNSFKTSKGINKKELKQ